MEMREEVLYKVLLKLSNSYGALDMERRLDIIVGMELVCRRRGSSDITGTTSIWYPGWGVITELN